MATASVSGDSDLSDVVFLRDTKTAMAKKRAGKSNPVRSSVSVPRGKKKAKSASDGPIRAICRFLGSLKLAVVLLMAVDGGRWYDQESLSPLEAWRSGEADSPGARTPQAATGCGMKGP